MTDERTPRDLVGVARDATTLQEVLAAFEEHGYSAQFRARPEGHVECVTCNTVVPAADLVVDGMRRLEGASDPDDSLAVVAAECRVCGSRATLVLGYGPAASPEDTDVLGHLEAPPPPAPEDVEI